MGSSEVATWFSTFASVITASSLIFAAIQIRINRKQLYLNTINTCLARFRALDLSDSLGTPKIFEYIDFVNEELFYFQHGYLPDDIAFEWLDGMIDYMPLFDRQENVLNKKNCILHLGAAPDIYLKNYPRIKHTFTIGVQFDIPSVYNEEFSERAKRQSAREYVVRQLYQNIKSYPFFNN